MYVCTGLGDSSAGLEVPPEDDEPAAGDDTASGNKRAPMLGEMRPQGSGGPRHSIFRSGGSFGPSSAAALGGASTPSGGGAAASVLRSQGGGFLLPAGLPPRSDAHRYRLRGVVAHVGTTDSGHYYSFIRAPASSSSSASSAAAAATTATAAAAAAGGGGAGGACGEDGDRWYEYNDQIVAPFDPADIPKECFGGVDRPPVVAAQGKGARGAATAGASGGGNERVRNNNAYLLFYERVGGEEAGDEGDGHPHHPHQQQEQQPPPQASPESARSASEDNRGEGEEVGSPALSELRRFRQGVQQRAGSIASYVEGHGGGSKGRRPGPSGGGGGVGRSPLSIAGSPAGATVVGHHQGQQSGHLPASVRRVVWSENMAFFRDRHLYAPAYHRFLLRLLQAEVSEPVCV